jgi:hypothetical protein
MSTSSQGKVNERKTHDQTWSAQKGWTGVLSPALFSANQRPHFSFELRTVFINNPGTSHKNTSRKIQNYTHKTRTHSNSFLSSYHPYPITNDLP